MFHKDKSPSHTLAWPLTEGTQHRKGFREVLHLVFASVSGGLGCFACNLQGHFRRECLNRPRSESSHREGPRTSKRSDGRQVHFSDTPTVGAASQVVPSVRLGALAMEKVRSAFQSKSMVSW